MELLQLAHSSSFRSFVHPLVSQSVSRSAFKRDDDDVYTNGQQIGTLQIIHTSSKMRQRQRYDDDDDDKMRWTEVEPNESMSLFRNSVALHCIGSSLVVSSSFNSQPGSKPSFEWHRSISNPCWRHYADLPKFNSGPPACPL